MLTPLEIQHFRTFGYVVLRGWLAEPEAASLAEEIDRALQDAYGPKLAERPHRGGVEGHRLPMMSAARTPLSLGLVTDDRFVGTAAQLLGRPALPTFAEAVLYFGEAGLHTDSGIPVSGVKFVTYTEPLEARTGALRLLPGSHHRDFAGSVWTWNRAARGEGSAGLRSHLEHTPLVVAETRPGDVVAFDLFSFHASVYGSDRRQWSVSYLADPATPDEAAAFREYADDGLEVPWPGWYDPSSYPHYDREWIERGQPRRVIERMRELGVFEAAGRVDREEGVTEP